MKKTNKKAVKKEKAVKKTELQKVMESVGEQLAVAIKKSRKVLKKVKCTKEQIDMFAKTKEMSGRLDEAQKLFDDMRQTMWRKIEKDLKVKSYGKKKISLQFNEEDKTISIIEDTTPIGACLGGVIDLNK